MPEKLYTIEGINKRSILDPAGRFVDVFTVSIVTASGVRDSIDFKQAEYTVPNVKKTLEETARKHEEIMKV